MLKNYLKRAKKGLIWQVLSGFVVKVLTIIMSLMSSMTIRSMRNIHDIVLYLITLPAFLDTFLTQMTSNNQKRTLLCLGPLINEKNIF